MNAKGQQRQKDHQGLIPEEDFPKCQIFIYERHFSMDAMVHEEFHRSGALARI